MDFNKAAPYLSNPLVLTGFAVFLLFGLYRTLVKSKLLRPVSPTASNRILRLLLHYGFAVAVLVIGLGFGLETLKQVPQLATFLPSSHRPKHLPQKARWGPLDGEQAGIVVVEGDDLTKTFVPWPALKPEIEKNLFPQVVQIPVGSSAEVVAFKGKDGWLVKAVGPDDTSVAYLWFGPDPKNHWVFDGLVRVGMADPEGHSVPVVWQTYQRYSDGSYLRQK